MSVTELALTDSVHVITAVPFAKDPLGTMFITNCLPQRFTLEPLVSRSLPTRHGWNAFETGL